jgi:hypothetical protein
MPVVGEDTILFCPSDTIMSAIDLAYPLCGIESGDHISVRLSMRLLTGLISS